MKSKLTKLITFIAVFCIVFTSIPFAAGSLDVQAAAKKKTKTARRITLAASSTGKNTAALSWNKIKKPNKGYAVFRDGDPIAYLGKSKTKFSDTGLKAGTVYSYQIKVYKTKKDASVAWVGK